MTIIELLLFLPLLGLTAILVGYTAGLGWYLGHTRKEQVEQWRTDCIKSTWGKSK